MNILSLGAAALFALSCAACHGEETRQKIENLEAEQVRAKTATKAPSASTEQSGASNAAQPQ